MAKSKKKSKKRKLNKKKLLIFVVIFLFLVFLVYKIFNTRITNIYVSGNDYFTDQQIIDMAGIKNYPKSINALTYNIQKKLESNKYILSAGVTKRKILSTVYIKVKENYPLFYYQVENKSVLYNGEKVDDKFSVPTVINQIPNTVYDKFLDKIKKLNKEALSRISEIEYEPNEVDQERFFLIMNDGNYVYVNIKKFLTLNKYLDMIKSFDNKKGILYLDSGEYFDIFD